MRQLATGAGAVVCSRLQRYLKKPVRQREGWLWQGILRWFPLCVHISSIYQGFTGAVDIARWSTPQIFFFRRTFSSYFYLMPNGHLTPIGGRAAIAILFGNAHIYVLSYLKSVCSFLFHIGWGMGSVLWHRHWLGASHYEIRHLLQRASIGAYLEAGFIWHMYGHAASTLFYSSRGSPGAGCIHRFYAYLWMKGVILANFALDLVG